MLINCSLGEILKLSNLVEGNIALDQNFLIKHITSLEDAGPEDLAILLDPETNSPFDQISLDKVKNSKAGFILASKPVLQDRQFIIAKDPLNSFTNIVQQMGECKDEPVIGDNCKIHESVYLGKNVTIGNNVTLNPGVKIFDGCVIGNNTIIHANSVIGSDGFGYRITPKGMQKVPQIGIVRIGNNVEIGACVTIDRAAFSETSVGDGTKIDNLVHIAHNVKIGPHCAILAQTGIAGSVQIGAGCLIGGQVAIKDHLKIGDGAKIISKSAVMKDVGAREIVAGIPAMPFSTTKKLWVILPQIPDLFPKIKTAIAKKSFWSRIKFWN